jgi:hypothetical protein
MTIQNAAPSTSFQDYLLAQMRCATLRARIMQADLDAIGIALKGGLITPDQAILLLDDCDALRLVGTERSDT